MVSLPPPPVIESAEPLPTNESAAPPPVSVSLAAPPRTVIAVLESLFVTVSVSPVASAVGSTSREEPSIVRDVSV